MSRPSRGDKESKLPFSSNNHDDDDDQLKTPIHDQQTSDYVIPSEVSLTDSSLEPGEQIIRKKKQKSTYAKKVTKDNSSHDLLPMHLVIYDGKKYDLSDQRSIDREFIQNQTKFIEDKLKLKMLGNDLSSLGKFVRLAYCGVVGNTDLVI